MLMKFLAKPSHPKAVIMLALRALSNLFKNQSSAHVAMLRRQAIIEHVAIHLAHDDKLVRQAAITCILNYSIIFQQKEDDEGRLQAISALANCDPNEKDLQNVLRLAYALGNLAHNSQDSADMIKTMEIAIPDPASL